MKLVLSRCHPIADAQTPTGYFAREALFRTNDGSFLLYMASEDKTGREERILFLDCRDALVQRFRGSNHIKRPRQVCKTKYG